MRRDEMKCQRCERCLSDQQAIYRAYSDLLSIKVCATCAGEALRLGIAVEVLAAEKQKNKLENSEFNSGIVSHSF